MTSGAIEIYLALHLVFILGARPTVRRGARARHTSEINEPAASAESQSIPSVRLRHLVAFCRAARGQVRVPRIISRVALMAVRFALQATR